MKKRMVFLMMLIATFGLFLACNAKATPNNTVIVSPTELFQGDTVRLEPHLGLLSGAVDVTYEGDQENISLKYEIWEEGILEFSEFIFSSSGENPGFKGEVSISLQGVNQYHTESSAPMTMTSVIRTANGYSSSSKPIEHFNQKFGYSPQHLTNEVVISADDEIPIWGVVASDGILTTGGEDLEHTVKRAPWGLLVKIYFE